MNAELNLCNILKGHEGKTFYSPVFGNLLLYSIGVDIVTFYIDDNTMISIYSNGKFNKNADELAVYPSDSLRDWDIWNKEANNKRPKTWNELENRNNEATYNLSIIDKYGLNKEIVEPSPIEKAALALLKIYQLIEAGYGGNITNEEWVNDDWKYAIEYYSNNKKFTIISTTHTKYLIAFHTPKQADEFLYHSENIQLLKDYSMITD